MYILKIKSKQHVSAIYGHHSEILIDIKPDDGHIRPKHVVLIYS